jgi:hypothetical protein
LTAVKFRLQMRMVSKRAASAEVFRRTASC